MPSVLNRHRLGGKLPAGSVYVGRPSKWGNPFVAGRDGSRAAVIRLYRMWLQSQESLLRDLHELRGKDLVCFCAPLPCHADVLLELANRGGVGGQGGGGEGEWSLFD